MIIGGPFIYQGHIRWRNDDGSETTATWKANEDVGITTDGGIAFNNSNLDVNIRLRIMTGNSADSGSVNPQLEYSHNSGAWTNVNGSSSVVRSSASTQFADNAATTTQMTDDGLIYDSGQMDEADGTFSASQTLFEEYTEHEWCFQIRSVDVANGDTIDLKATSSGTDYNSYSKIARATLSLTSTRRIMLIS